ncbi:putative DNA polymerase [Holothuria leucospilota]|uniref:DNA-directed DNA polymerase n=1 Tax=Holothuria leucospilota TaxID=206669 RepID=A0A9Q1BLX3_HOLLE|nr:putative DNA polymerase [Holothuria leucospilota]
MVRKQKNGVIRPHNCNEYFCRVCKITVKDGHKCTMQVYVDKKLKGKEGKGDGQSENLGSKTTKKITETPHKYIFFDFETIQETGTHVPYLCVAQMVCELCLSEPFEEECQSCEEKQVVFKGVETKRQFCEWLLSPKRRNATCIAHNLKGFDGYFILQHLYDNGVVPNIITNGAKVMSIEVLRNGIRCIDSINFLPMSLASLPKTFGIEELKKGYFPHLFNTSENQNYVGPLPDSSYYSPDSMKTEKRAEFFKWYEEEKKKDYLFDLQKELLMYCISDVDILRRCCLLFRSIFMSITVRPKNYINDDDSEQEGCRPTKDQGVDPFRNCITIITIASACNLVFRRIFKATFYSYFTNQKQKNYSHAALEWLHYESRKRGKYITHAQNEGEEKIGPYRVDGFAQEGKIIFAYQGCFWHGCLKFYYEDTIHTVNQKPKGLMIPCSMNIL